MGSGLAATTSQCQWCANFQEMGILTKGVIVGNVGRKTTDKGWRSSVLVQGAEKLGSWLDVCGPSKPSSMTSIEVHVDANRVELLDSVCNCGLKEFNKNKR